MSVRGGINVWGAGSSEAVARHLAARLGADVGLQRYWRRNDGVWELRAPGWLLSVHETSHPEVGDPEVWATVDTFRNLPLLHTLTAWAASALVGSGWRFEAETEDEVYQGSVLGESAPTADGPGRS